MAVVCESLFRGFLQKTEHSGAVGAGRVTVARIKVFCSETGHSGCKNIAMEMFCNRGNKKLLQGDNEPVQDISPAGASCGAKGVGVTMYTLEGREYRDTETQTASTEKN